MCLCLNPPFFMHLPVSVRLLVAPEIDCPSTVLCWGEYCSSCSHVANISPDHPPIDSGCCANCRAMCSPVPLSSDKQPIPGPPITLKMTFWSGNRFFFWGRIPWPNSPTVNMFKKSMSRLLHSQLCRYWISLLLSQIISVTLMIVHSMLWRRSFHHVL